VKLAPCPNPFCPKSDPFYNETLQAIQCRRCGLQGFWGFTENYAIISWNNYCKKEAADALAAKDERIAELLGLLNKAQDRVEYLEGKLFDAIKDDEPE
jgi:hypothetical protein